MWLTVSRVAVVALIVLSEFGQVAQAQDDNTDATKRILLKMAVERAKLIQFECEVHVSTETPTHKPDFLLPQSVSQASFELYFSAIGQYWIQVTKYKDPGTQEDVELVYGVLSNSTVLGQLRNKEEDVISIISSDEPLEKRERFLYDFRVIGLGFPGDHFLKRKFENVESDIFDQMLDHVPRDDGTVRIKWGEGHVLDIDSKQGYWPTYARTVRINAKGVSDTSSEWRIRLVEVNDVWVPKTARFETGEFKFNFDYDWKKVNEPILKGREGVKAIADRKGVQIVDRKIRVP